MHFFKAALGALALASSVIAQSANLGFTSAFASVKAGQSTTIKYDAPNLDDPVTITLRKGDPANLQTISVLTSSATGGSYTWKVPSSLANADDYALQITQGNEINYSGEFSLSGGSASSSASSTTSSASSSSSSSSHGVTVIPGHTTLSTPLSSTINMTATATHASASLGTGSPIHRNTTMSSATLSRTGSGSSSSVPASTTAGASSTASFISTSTSAAASSTSSGAASSNVFVGSSPIALVLCAVAAIVF